MLNRTVRALAGLLIVGAAAPLSAQVGEAQSQEPDTTVFEMNPILVTATRGPRLVTRTPRPVSVVNAAQLDVLNPNSVGDIFRGIPGLEVTGVGPNQARPAIRGQRGQRILLLADGLRLNNTRRQRDFGELPALVNVEQVEQVEVVRGPASVLYGSDAIGGVVNIITRVPMEDGFHGSAGFRYSDVASQNQFDLRTWGRTGGFSYQIGGMVRDASSYSAPSGSFGNIILNNDAAVNGTGLEDQSFDARFGYDFSEQFNIFAKVEQYSADNAGFGFVNPALYGSDDPTIDISYPEQSFTKASFGLRAGELDFALADRVEILGYGQDNERGLNFLTTIAPFPGASIVLDNRNFTDIRTYGFRAEARKLLGNFAGGPVLLTYGVDGFQDRSEGTDLNTTTLTGFGPFPSVTEDNRPSIPTAEFFSLGAFAQAEFQLGDRVSLVGGGRYQRVSAESFATPNLDDVAPTSSTDGTFVGALNGIVEMTDTWDAVVSIGRGFRSPNLVELFFEGPLATSGAFQEAGTELKAETSFNVDVGARYQNGPVFFEAFFFQNRIFDGIRAQPVRDANGDIEQVNGLDLFRNVNLEEIIFRGFEVNAQLAVGGGFSIGAGYSELQAEDAIDPLNPVGEAYSSKLTTELRYEDPSGRFWGQWDIRRQGEQRSVELGTNPIGDVIPDFTLQNIRAGVRLFEFGGVNHGLNLALTNLTNALYAETANASFFRPEPGRNITVAYQVSF